MNPELRAPPPVKPTTVSTAGSLPTIATKASSLPCIDWNELLWSARSPPVTRPVSCWGKKPLGTIVYRYTFSPMVVNRMSSISQAWSSTHDRLDE